MNFTMIRSPYRFLTTAIQRDPDRWLYKKIYTNIKCFIVNRQNAYSNYFAALKCQSDYSPEIPCRLNKFEKFNVEQVFKLNQQFQKLLAHKSVGQHGAFIQSLINEHQKAKNERKEYSKYIQSLDNGRELKPLEEDPSIKRLEHMRNEYHAALLRRHEDELSRKKAAYEAKKAARKLKDQELQKQLREQIDADKRTLEKFKQDPSEKSRTTTKRKTPNKK